MRLMHRSITAALAMTILSMHVPSFLNGFAQVAGAFLKVEILTDNSQFIWLSFKVRGAVESLSSLHDFILQHSRGLLHIDQINVAVEPGCQLLPKLVDFHLGHGLLSLYGEVDIA